MSDAAINDARGVATSWVPAVGTFGARLAMVRHLMGWNQKEAALACGIPPASWRQWEIMGSLPRDVVGVSGQIAQHTAVDHMWMLTGTPSATAVEMDGFGALQEWADHTGLTLDWCTPRDLNPEPTVIEGGALAEVISIDQAWSTRVRVEAGGEAA